jgi:prepilin-type N-terminal cleavage/methylation domain-containing protein/prepilin-type processing-associated H-X9-DG protein
VLVKSLKGLFMPIQMNKKAFTLIELLVVISIIALLMAIIIPILNRGKKLARSIQCRSILKGLFTAHYTYFLENNELVKVSGVNGNYDPWFTYDPFRVNLKLEPLSSEYKTWKGIDGLQDYKASYPKEFICPAAKYSLERPEDKLYQIDRSYGINFASHSGPWDGFRDSINETSDWIFIGDAIDRYFTYWDCDKYVKYGEVWLDHPYTSGSAAFRHIHKANMFYLDGHADLLTPKEVKNKLREWVDRH